MGPPYLTVMGSTHLCSQYTSLLLLPFIPFSYPLTHTPTTYPPSLPSLPSTHLPTLPPSLPSTHLPTLPSLPLANPPTHPPSLPLTHPPFHSLTHPSSLPSTHQTAHPPSSLVPRPPRPVFVACSTKSRGRPGQIYHVIRAAADVMFSLLTYGFVLSPSLFFP